VTLVLADTSVWVDHLRRGDAVLAGLLDEGQVISHPYITGELACGNLKNRTEVLSLLKSLPTVVQPDDEEILFFVDKKHLHGKGLGYVDVSLLAACLMNDTPMYTRDIRLNIVAHQLGVAFPSGRQ
jgi:predicted nucleic acid-binding protein